ncbi:probable polyketide synthase 1 isoform X1 [Asterias amurensis]|uniref:probable polyketide synthase 1 isoform X1 n=1 Tax=Asterias amurensis TaxID=7602 RepID=UPI003AB88F60
MEYKYRPIAIVGIGCRMPGGVKSPDEFWKVIHDGRNTITEVPPDRWSLDNFYHPDQTKQGKMVTRRCGFIDGIDKFDNTFFKISPREAISMDPQQRHILEVVNEAFEDAGIVPDTVGESAGVYLGIGMMDYPIQSIGETSLIDAYTVTGSAHSVAANRVSYAFDLKGPSYAVDTACASSMTAMHLACTGIWNNECNVAVLGGCNNLLMPDVTVGFSALGVLSPEGQCCPFSSSAKGYVRSEGFGALILKPLQQAIDDGDHIYASIRGSAIAANGFSNSLTMPSMPAQMTVMKQAYERFDVPLSSVHCIEAHGTGTPVGDPIEAEAIGKTFAPHRETPLRIGSVKSNFGHNECAAGVTAAIKVALMLEKKMLCPTINYTDVNPHIDTEEWKLQVQTKLEPIPDGQQTIIGLNSFGFAGAVAHMIFQEPPARDSPDPESDSKSFRAQWQFGGSDQGNSILIPLSAKSTDALNDVAEKWKNFSDDKDALKVVSWLSTRRKHHECRLAVITKSGEQFQKQLASFVKTGSGEGMSSGSAYGKKRQICMIFPGQGQQWGNMGRQLYRTEKVFREIVQKCDEIFQKLSGWSLLHDKLFFNGLNSMTKTGDKIDADQLINDMEISQPAILFFQIGLFHLWQFWGIIPDVVVGHSLGEVAAAYACGGLTIDEAVRVIYHRSTQQAKVKGAGSMAALRLSLKDAQEICSKSDKLYIAALNAPSGITIAGDTELITEFAKNNPTVAKQLRVQCAFHTPEMDPMEKSFRAAMKGAVETEAGCRTLPMYSTVTGELYKGDFGTDYWWDNIRNTVQFQPAVEAILEDTEADLFLECGSSATLISSVNQIAKQGNIKSNITSICSGQRRQDDRYMVLKALGELYIAGLDVNWKNVTGDCAEWVSIPTYPWQHQSFWVESEPMRMKRLGLDDRTFKGQNGNMSLLVFPFLADHIVQDRLVFPGAGYVEYAIEASFPENELPCLSSVTFCKLLMWPEKTATGGSKFGNLQLGCNMEGSKVQIVADGTMYSEADITANATILNDHIPMKSILSRCTSNTPGGVFYSKLAALGLQYGPAFQVIEKIAIGDGEALGYLYPAPVNKQRLQISHLDGCFQLLISAIGDTSTLYLPVAIKSLKMHVPSLPASESFVAHVKVTECDSLSLTGDIILATNSGKVLMEVVGCKCQNVVGTTSDVPLSSCLYHTKLQTQKAALPPTSAVYDVFEPYCLQENYPEEIDPISKAVDVVHVLQAICVSYIRHAFGEVPAEDRGKCNPRYIKRLEQIAADDTVDDIPFEQIPIVIKDIMQRIPELKQELTMMTSLGDNLPTTLRDPSTAVSILFAAENIAHYFIDSLTTRLYYKAGAKMIENAVKEAAKSKGVVRVVEVGGRMGGLASYILEPLKQLGMENKLEYIFTDLSASFFTHAQGRLQEYPFVKYQQLDIETDVEPQGFVPGSVDIVVCMDTLHSAVDLNNGLHHMRNLLCPEGWLVMYEATNSKYISELLFGALELCWAFQDFRTDVCWLDQQGWVDLMKNGGFTDVFAVSSPNEFFHSIMIGKKSIEECCPEEPESDWLVVSDSTFPGNGNVLRALKDSLPQNTIFASPDRKLDDALEGKKECAHLVYILGQADWKAKQLTRVLQEVNEDSSRFSQISVVTTGSKTSTAVAVGLIRAATNQCQVPMFSFHLDDELKESLSILVKMIVRCDIKDREISIRQGEVLLPRLVKAEIPAHDTNNDTYWQLIQNADMSSKNASIDDMGFSYLCEMEPPPGKVMVKVNAAALNFKDVMMALGLLSGLDEEDERAHFGLECSGVVVKIGAGVTSLNIGDEVVGFGKHCFASHTISDEKLLVPKPSNLNWVESAGISVIFSTAYYSLVERAYLQKDETVLIHSACGGVGLAAIQVARMIGAKIICSAGSEKKRSYLREELGIEMVTDSRSERFYDDVMSWTEGNGVDVVLNSLSGRLLLKGIECLSLGGRFCEIGKRDILQKTNLLLMPLLLENKSVLSCQIDRIVALQKNKAQRLMRQVVSLFDKGAIKPIHTETTSITDFADTFRIMAKASHIGKVVFDIPKDYKPLQVVPTCTLFKVNATYIVTGGYGGLGQAFARWLCKKGARHVALVSRRGCHNASARRTVTFLKRRGVKVYDFAVNLADASSVQTILRQLNEVHNAPVVRGIFHLAGFIAEESLSDLTPELMDNILGAKAASARHLHNLTDHLPLDFFLMTSSVTAVWGHPSQPCYTAANVYLDELAEERKAKGLPATSLQLGPVRGAGYLESNSDVVKTLGMKGNMTLHIDEVLQVVGQILQAKDSPAVLCLANQDWDATLRHCHNDSLKFRHLTLGRQVAQTDCDLSQEDLEDRVRQKMGQLLCVEPGSIDLQQPMINYGIDSLMAVEMVTWASKELNVIISQLDILGGICTNVLLEKALDHSVVINVAE